MAKDHTVNGINVKVGFDTVALSRGINNFKNQMKVLNKGLKEANAYTSLSGKAARGYADQLNITKEKVRLTGDEVNKYKSKIEELQAIQQKGTALDEKQSKALERNKIHLQNAQLAYAEAAREYQQYAIKHEIATDATIQQAKRMQEVGKSLQENSKRVGKFADGWTRAGVVMGLGVAGIVGSALKYEEAFAGVRKTVDADESTFKRLSDGIRDMALRIPIGTTELANLAEQAGQLGIQTPNILGFVEVMGKLNTATNLGAEGAQQLAKFANITQMSQQDFDKLGSSIVDLGNKFATTEADIVNMSLNLAGAGTSIGLTQAQILGIATGLSSLGIEAERGGSTFSKLMVNMKVATETGLQKANEVMEVSGMNLRELEILSSHNATAFKELAAGLGHTTEELEKIVSSRNRLEDFAHVAGVTAEKFAEMFANDPSKAIGLFIDGLSKAEEKGTTAIAMLDEMGISEIRLRDTLLRTGSAQGLLNKAVETSTKAWADNNALNKEAEKRYATSGNQMKLQLAKLKDLAITMGQQLLPSIVELVKSSQPVIDMLKSGVEWFAKLDDGTKKTATGILAFAIAGGPVLKFLSNIGQVGGGALSLFGKLLEKKSTAEATARAIAGIGGSMGEAATKGGGLLSTMLNFATAHPVITATAVAVGAIGIAFAAWASEQAKNASLIQEWGSSIDLETAKALDKMEEFSTKSKTYLSTAYTIDDNAKRKIDESVNHYFTASKEAIDKSKKEFESMYAELPEIVRQRVSETFSDRIGGYERVAQESSRIESEITAIYAKAHEERRQLTSEELAKIEQLYKEHESNVAAIISPQEQGKILSNFQNNLTHQNLQDLQKSQDIFVKQIEENQKEYADKLANLKDALAQGLIGYSDYSEGVNAIGAEIGRRNDEAMTKLALILREKYNRGIFTDEEFDAGMEQLVQRFGYTRQRVNELIGEMEVHAERTKALIADVSGEVLSNLSQVAKDANAKWAGIITDQTTGKITDNIQSVLAEAIRTKDGWENLQFVIKNATLTSNAKDEIKTAIEAAGKWEELDPTAKELLVSSNTGEIIKQAIQSIGGWDELDPKTQQLIATSNVDETMANVFIKHKLWQDTEFLTKLAQIDTNSPTAKQEFEILLQTWQNTELPTKKAPVDSEQVKESQKRTETFQSLWNNFAPQEKRTSIITNANEAKYAVDQFLWVFNSIPSTKNVIMNVVTSGLNALRSIRGYAKGTDFHVGGLAVLGDGGRREPFLTPSGHFGVSPSTDTMYDLPRGTKVWSSVDRFKRDANGNVLLRLLKDRLPHFATGTSKSFLDKPFAPRGADFGFLRPYAKGDSVTNVYHGAGENRTINLTLNIQSLVGVPTQEQIDALTRPLMDNIKREMNYDNINMKGGVSFG